MDSQDKNQEKIPEKSENNQSKKGESTKVGKKSIKFSPFAIIPVVIVIVAVAVLFIFVLHPGKANPSVSYTPINIFSQSGLSSIIGGNWTIIYNTTINSTTVDAHTTSFPPGTISAAAQEFVPYSEASLLNSNSTTNRSPSVFSSEVFYINSSSLAASLFSRAESTVRLQFSNDTKINFNISSVGNSNMVYVTGRANVTNTTMENVSYVYISNGKDLIVDTLQNGSFSYGQAKNLATFPFLNSA